MSNGFFFSIFREDKETSRLSLLAEEPRMREFNFPCVFSFRAIIPQRLFSPAGSLLDCIRFSSLSLSVGPKILTWRSTFTTPAVSWRLPLLLDFQFSRAFFSTARAVSPTRQSWCPDRRSLVPTILSLRSPPDNRLL